MSCKLSFTLLCIAMLASCISTKMDPPQPYGVLPTDRQLAWHEMEMYNMIEFNQNNALDIHWGWGNESPELVNPVDFDAEKIVLLAKKIGSKGFLINAKHHGGFCMWPTKTLIIIFLNHLGKMAKEIGLANGRRLVVSMGLNSDFTYRRGIEMLHVSERPNI